jgi:hypothetical protein
MMIPAWVRVSELAGYMKRAAWGKPAGARDRAARLALEELIAPWLKSKHPFYLDSVMRLREEGG